MTIRRTALIAWDYPPSASGLAVAAREVAESLSEAGVAVSVYTLDRSDSVQLNGIPVIGCLPNEPRVSGIVRRRMALGHLVGPRWFATRIAADHAANPFDCLEATNWYAPGALACRIDSLPFVTRHSTPAASTGAVTGSLRDRIDGRFACLLEAASARRSNGHVFNTASHGEKVIKLYTLDERVPSAVVGLSLPPERLRAASLAPYPAADTPVELVFVGRAELRKGFDCLIDAVERLAAEAKAGVLPAFHLRLVGILPYDLEPLSEGARAFVTPMGRLTDPELDAVYRQAHIVLAPSRYESFGLVYQEALAFGRPVVALATDPSARQVVGESGAGHLARDATGKALADALRPLIGDGVLRRKLRKTAFRAAGRFSRASLGAETLALYEAATTHHRHAR